MSCDIIVKASNGNPSIAFNAIKKLTNNAEKAHTLYIQLTKPNFNNWFNGSTNVDINGEPVVDDMGLINNGKEQKSVFNFGSFGKQNTEKDVVSYLQSANVVTKKSYQGSYWIKKGDGTSDGTYTSLLERNIAKLDTFNKVYYEQYGQPLVHTHKAGTSFKVTVNNTLLELLNNRNNDSVYYSSVVEEIGDMDANAMQIMSNNLKNFTVEEESYGLNIVTGFVIKLAPVISKLTMADAVKGNTVKSTVSKVLKHKSQQFLDAGDITTAQHKVNIKIADEMVDETSLFWTKLKAEVRTNSGFIITDVEELQQDEDTVNNSFNENMQFIMDPHERVSNQIKDLINTSPVLESNKYEVVNDKIVPHVSRKTPGGIVETLRFIDVSGYLVQNISTTNSVKDMITKLEEIAKYYNPSFSNIVKALKADSILAADFFTSFKNESPNRIITELNPSAETTKDQIKTVIKNKSSFVRYQLADNWINTLQMYKYSDFYNQTGSIKVLNNKYDLLYGNLKNRVTDVAKINTIVSYFKAAGINIDHHIVTSVLDHPSYNLDAKGNPKTTNVILDEVFGLVIHDINTYINTDNSKLGDVRINKNLITLGSKLQLFYNPTTSAYINITGNQEQTFNKPTFLGDWFNMMENDVDFLEYLTGLVKDPRTRFSNWLITTKNNEGFLKLPEGIATKDVMTNLDKLVLNKEFYKDSKFAFEFYDGITHKSTSQSMRYSDIVDNDWNYLNVVNYFNREEQARYSLISPADRGNSRFIKAPRFSTKRSNYDNKNNLSVNTKLYKAIHNIFVGETNRISKEYDYVFDENGEVKRTLDKLYVDYHYKLDKNNKPIFKDSKGNPVGNAFKYHYFDYITNGVSHSMNDLFVNTIPDISILNDKEISTKVNILINNMINSMTNEQILLNKNNKPLLYDNVIKPYGLTFEQGMVEYTLNRFIANAEMINMFMGDVAFYGNADKANKRATELLASGVVNNSYGTKDTFNGVTIHNRIITNAPFLSNMRKTLTSQKVDPTVINTIIKQYEDIDSGDAQSYVTWDEYINRLKKFGIYNKYKDTIAKIEDETKTISGAELNEFANAFKNFYYGYEFDGMRMVPNQVKNSEQPLIPRFIKGTELEAMYNEMKKQGIVQINFASAEKVGSRYIADISTEDGSMKLDKLASEFKLASKPYYYKHLRKQQDIVNHSIDTVNKLGVQIAKKIIDNVADNTKIQELFGLYVSNIEESADDLLNDLGITRSTTGEYTVNKEKLSEILLDSSIDRGVVNNILQGLALDETGEFKIPLDHSTTRVKNEAMITSLFTNRVISQKFAGIHGPQMSNAFMRNIKDGKVKTSDDLKFTQYTGKDGKSGYQKAQVLLPAWSKKFFSKEGNITIEQLKAAGLDTMIGYRIPTEDKHSMVVFEVVGFLDSSLGSTMIVPTEFVPQTGADFDIDSIYTMQYNFKVNKQGKISKISYYKTNEEAYQGRYGNNIDLLGRMNDIIEAEKLKEEAFTLTDQAVDKLLSDLLGSLDYSETELKEIFEENGLSLELYKGLQKAVKNYPSKEEFAKITDPNQYNTREARDNRILDIYIEVLQDPSNYLEVASPNSIAATNESRELAEGIYNPLAMASNFLSPTVQDIYRKKALAGRKLKGMSVNRDSFISVAQKINLKLKDGFSYKFDLSKYKLSKLKEVYGEESVQEDGTVHLINFGNNATNTFTNIDGQLITSYVAQSTAHILDNVKFPLPYNVTDFTFNVWRVIPELGGTWNSATLLINQEAIVQVIKRNDDTTSIHSNSKDNAIRNAKYDLLRAIAYRSRNNEEFIAKVGNKDYTKYVKKAKKDGISTYIPYNVLDEIHATHGVTVTLSDEYLTKNLKDYSKHLKGEESVDYLFNQVNILEQYAKLDEIASQIGDFQTITSYDKSRVGPTFSEIKDKMDVRAKVDGVKSPTSDYIREYNNLLVVQNEAGEYIPYTDAIFKQENSAYPSIKAYYENGAKLANDIFENEFITESVEFRRMLQSTPKVNRKSITDYTIAKVLSSLPFFQGTNVNQLLGTNKSLEDLDISKITKENLEKFESMSVANKVRLVKIHYKDFIDSNNILYHITTKLDDKFDHQGIGFTLDTINDNIIDSFKRMWYNKNPYYHLLAKDLVKYAYFVKGFTFGRNLSKVIPTEILYNEPTIIDEIEGVDIINGIGYTSHLLKQRNLHFENSTYIDYGIIHKINHARSNTKNRNIVPRLKHETEYNEQGYKVTKRGKINWNSKDSDGVITVGKELYSLTPKERSANVILITTAKKIKGTTEYTNNYYAKISVRSKKNIEADYTTTTYYVPVNQLETYEFDSLSRNPEYNVHQPLEYYLNKIARTHQGDILADNTKEILDNNNITNALDDSLINNEDILSSTVLEELPNENDDFINYNNSIIKHAQAITSDYSLRNKVHSGNELLQTTTKSLKNINYEDNQIAGLIAALRIDADYSHKTISALERKLYSKEGYINKDVLLKAIADPTARVEFTTFMNYAHSFLTGLERIKNLQRIKKDSLTNDEESLNKAIARLTELGSRVNELRSTHKTIMNTYFENMLTPISSNPEIKLGIRGLFDIQDDESKIQMLLDSLADSNNSFIANYIKQFIIDREIAHRSIKDTQEEYDKQMIALNAIAELPTIMGEDNQLIQEFDQQYKQDFQDYLQKQNETEELHGRYSKEFYAIEREFNKWKLDNIESNESTELETAKFNINDTLNKHIEAREAYDKIKEAKRAILSNYDGIIDYTLISEIDTNRLAELEREAKLLASTYDINGNRKTGKDIAIAKTIAKYRESYQNLFDTYYKPSAINKAFAGLLAKNKTLNTPEAREWLAKNTKAKIKDNFWTEFEKHATTLGKEHTPSEIMDALKPYKDSDGTINGRAVPANLVKQILNNDRAKSADVEPRTPKAIKKPTNNEHYSTEYYDKFENKGYDSRDDHPMIKKYKEDINDILYNYVNDEGLLDTSSIGLSDLKDIQALELKVKENSIQYSIDSIRDEFNEWLNKTHDTVIDKDKFKKADNIAKSKGKEYHDNWTNVNTQLSYADDYYTKLNDLRVQFGLTKSFSANENEDGDDTRTVTVTNLDIIRQLHKVESIKDLPPFVRRSIVSSKHYNIYDAATSVYSLSDYLKEHTTTKTGKTGKPIKRTWKDIKDATAHISRLRMAKLEVEKGRQSKIVHYKDALLKFHKYNTTPEYKALLEQHGEDSEWYNDNHIINHQGKIVPAHYWTIERPQDATLYEENAPRKSYWGYSNVKDKSYVDRAKTVAKTWNNENITYTTTEYYDKTKAEMRMKSNDEYTTWFFSNHYLNNYTNKYEPISIWTKIQPSSQYVEEYAPASHLTDMEVKDEHTREARTINNYALPKETSKYKNKEYDKVKDKPLYKYMDGLMKKHTAHYKKDTIADEHQLPIMYKATEKEGNLAAKTLLKKLGWYNYASREVVGENNDGVRILNMPFMNDFVEQELLEVPKEKEFTNRAEYLKRYNEVIRQNKEIKAANKQFTKDHLDRDWIKVMRNFINASMNHEFIYNKEHEMKLVLEEIRNLDMTKRRNIVQRLRNITRVNAAKDQPGLYADDTGLATTKGINSNLEQHFRSFTDMIFYGEFELDEGTWTKVARVLQNATSAKGMWLNVPGAFNNVAYGKTQMALERFSGYFFSNKDRIAAEKLYTANMFNMMAEVNSETSTSLTNALIKHMDVVELQDEMAMSNNKFLDTSVKKHLLSTSSFYLLHHIGEHYMQNAAMLAMMHSNRLINGKIQSYTEYTFDVRYNALHDALGVEGQHEFDKFIRDNKNTDRYLDGKEDMIRDFILSNTTEVKESFLKHLNTLKEKATKEFNSNPRLIDVYELKDGKAAVKEGHEITGEQFALFRRKVVSTNQKMHGIYNKLDAGSIQKYALGRLAIQFKKWMRPGFTKRFGSRVGKSHWNESRNELDRGMYVSTFNFLTKPIFNGFKNMKGEEQTAMKALGNIFRDYGKYVSNIGIYWHTLNDSDKANILRTGVEMLYFAGAATMMMILQGLARGDEDDKKWAYLLYATDRLKTEILAYNPAYGFTNETRKLMRDPFAAMGFMDDVFKLVYTSIFERDAYYKGGIYHGESKLRIQTMKNIPLANRWLRRENIQDYAGYYKLY